MADEKPIKFSHRYVKLPFGEEKAVLLGVEKRKIEELPADFIDYDTEYYRESMTSLYYQLPEKGDFLILFFWAKQVFTTIRRWTPEKEKYYRSMVGKTFKIEVSP
jgi:hypothetical protein